MAIILSILKNLLLFTTFFSIQYIIQNVNLLNTNCYFFFFFIFAKVFSKLLKIKFKYNNKKMISLHSRVKYLNHFGIIMNNKMLASLKFIKCNVNANYYSLQNKVLCMLKQTSNQYKNVYYVY